MKLIFENWRTHLNEKNARLNEIEVFKDAFGEVIANFMEDIINNGVVDVTDPEKKRIKIRYLDEVNETELVEEMVNGAGLAMARLIGQIPYESESSGQLAIGSDEPPTPEHFARRRYQQRQQGRGQPTRIREDEE